jgi:hypothetical protein
LYLVRAEELPPVFMEVHPQIDCAVSFVGQW